MSFVDVYLIYYTVRLVSISQYVINGFCILSDIYQCFTYWFVYCIQYSYRPFLYYMVYVDVYLIYYTVRMVSISQYVINGFCILSDIYQCFSYWFVYCLFSIVIDHFYIIWSM